MVKIPKWPFDKFQNAERRSLGTQMKATGEVMGIAPSVRGRADEGRALPGSQNMFELRR